VWLWRTGGRRMGNEAGALALVIGGGSGIGAALADAYRAQGTNTVTWDIAGPHDVSCDVTEPDAIDDAVAVTRERWGVPDCVTVTAGVGHAGLLTEAEPDAFDRVMRVNARGPWLCMRAWVGPLQEQRTAGSFVAVSSVSARLVDRSMGIYCASKAALSMLAGVAERTALGRLGEAPDIAETIIALHAMGWVTGQVLECDGGLSLHSPADPYGAMVQGRPPEEGR